MNPLIGLLYPGENAFLTPLSKELKSNVAEQLKDNKGAIYARMQSVALQVSGSSSYEIDRINLRNDLVAIYAECSGIPISAITDNYGIDHQELMAIHHAEPVSIVSCVQCRAHLPAGDRRTLLRQLYRLRYLSRIEVGELVELDVICELLCDVNGCSQQYRVRYEEELRSSYLSQKARNTQLKKMSLAEYYKTREWGAKRNRALIQAGNRCQVCKAKVQLEVHHNSYERYGEELLEDLVVLCRECHQIYHGVQPEAA